MQTDPSDPPRSGGPAYHDPVPPALERLEAQAQRLARLSKLYPFKPTPTMMPADFPPRTSTPDGGPAFPQLNMGMKGDFPGMSLRDYFAAAALQGALANDRLTAESDSKHIVAWSYEVADLMLVQRDKPKCP